MDVLVITPTLQTVSAAAPTDALMAAALVLRAAAAVAVSAADI
jgi:hypothetical protein